MNLSTSSKGKYKVVRVIAGTFAKNRLSALGIVPNRIIEKMDEAHFQGPILVKVFESTLAIGRVLASRVIIDELDDS